MTVRICCCRTVSIGYSFIPMIECQFLWMVLSIVPVEFIGSFCGNCLHVVSFRGIWGFVWELRLDSLVRFCCVIDLKGNDGGIEKELWRVCRSIPISLGKWAVLAGFVRNWKNSYFSVLGHPSICLLKI